MMNLLNEPHNFRHNDAVFVHFRKTPEVMYEGNIYSIIKKPLQVYPPNSPLIDYFYIKFVSTIYDKILFHGMRILCKGYERTIASIERDNNNKIIKIYLFNEMPLEPEVKNINIDDIDAVLIWRAAFCILPKKMISRL